jgi:hypothetical protein
MFKKLRKMLSDASIVDRKDFKTSLKSCLGVIAVAAAAATTILLTATAAPLIPALVGVAIWAGVMGTIAVTATADTLKEDIKIGKATVEWETRLGQKVKSTAAEQKDLQWAQKELRKDPLKFQSMIEQFRAVTDKVTIVQDIKNGNGKFHYAQPKPF